MILAVPVAGDIDAFIAPIKFNGTPRSLRRELFKVEGEGGKAAGRGRRG